MINIVNEFETKARRMACGKAHVTEEAELKQCICSGWSRGCQLHIFTMSKSLTRSDLRNKSSVSIMVGNTWRERLIPQQREGVTAAYFMLTGSFQIQPSRPSPMALHLPPPPFVSKVSQTPKTVTPAGKQMFRHMGFRGRSHVQPINHVTLLLHPQVLALLEHLQPISWIW